MTDQSGIQQKVDGLNKVAWDHRVKDSKKAMAFSQEAIRLSRDIGYRKGLNNGLIVEGFCFIRISDMLMLLLHSRKQNSFVLRTTICVIWL